MDRVITWCRCSPARGEMFIGAALLMPFKLL